MIDRAAVLGVFDRWIDHVVTLGTADEDELKNMRELRDTVMEEIDLGLDPEAALLMLRDLTLRAARDNAARERAN